MDLSVFYMSISQFLCLCAISLTAYGFICRPPWKNLPPGPPVLPILGSLPFLPSIYALNVLSIFNRMERVYGRIWMAKLGVNNVVVLSDFKLIKEAFSTKGTAFQGRPSLYMFTDIFENTGIVATHGKIWKHNMSYLLKCIKTFEKNKTPMENLVIRETGHLLDEIQLHSGQAIDPSRILKKALANITCSFAFGERRGYRNPELEEHILKTGELFYYVGNNSLLNVYPITQYLPGDIAHSKKALRLRNDIFAIYNKWIENHKRKLADSEPKQPLDLIYAYLIDANIQSHRNKEFFSETHLLNMMHDIFIGGTDTSSTTLAWAVLYMALYPDIQQQVQEEIAGVLGSDLELTYADKNNLPFTEACLNEAARLGGVIPLGVPHATIEDVMLGGYFIPKDTMILVNNKSLFSDPEIWPEPEKFDPKRFLDEDGIYRQREEFIPFSIGKRSCPGKSLAQMELFLIFVSLLRKFCIQFPQGKKPQKVKGKLGLTYHPADCTVVFQNR